MFHFGIPMSVSARVVQWQRWLAAGEPSVRRPWRAGAAAAGGAPCPTEARGSGGGLGGPSCTGGRVCGQTALPRELEPLSTSQYRLTVWHLTTTSAFTTGSHLSDSALKAAYWSISVFCKRITECRVVFAKKNKWLWFFYLGSTIVMVFCNLLVTLACATYTELIKCPY